MITENHGHSPSVLSCPESDSILIYSFFKEVREVTPMDPLALCGLVLWPPNLQSEEPL